MAGAAADINNNYSKPCEVCKYQRRKCDPDCIMRGIFPPDTNRSSDLRAVSSIIGIANMTRMIKEVNTEEERKAVAITLCWEAQMRIKDPIEGVFGCYSKVRQELEQYRYLIHHLQQQQATQQGINNMMNDRVVNNGTDTRLMNNNCGVQENRDFCVTGGTGVSIWEERPGLPVVDQSRFMMQHGDAAMHGNMRDGFIDLPSGGVSRGHGVSRGRGLPVGESRFMMQHDLDAIHGNRRDRVIDLPGGGVSRGVSQGRGLPVGESRSMMQQHDHQAALHGNRRDGVMDLPSGGLSRGRGLPVGQSRFMQQQHDQTAIQGNMRDGVIDLPGGGVSREKGLPVGQSRFMQQQQHDQAAIHGNRRDGVMDLPDGGVSRERGLPVGQSRFMMQHDHAAIHGSRREGVMDLPSGGVSRGRGLPVGQSSSVQQQHDQAAIQGNNMRSDGVMVPHGNVIGLESGHNNVSDHQNLWMNEQGAEMQVMGNSGTRSSSDQVAAYHEWLTL